MADPVLVSLDQLGPDESVLDSQRQSPVNHCQARVRSEPASRDVKFEPMGPSLGLKSDLAWLLHDLNASCWDYVLGSE